MKNTGWLLLSLLFLLACNKTSLDKPKPNIVINCTENPKVCNVGEANNSFGIDLFKDLHNQKPSDNIFLSPTSLGSALSMTANGAKSKTLDEMRSTLHIDQMSMEEMNKAYADLLQFYPDIDTKVKLKLANSIWPKIGYDFKQSFLDINKTNFDSEVNPIDFSNPETITFINTWIEDHTDGLIVDAILSLPGNVVMLLINTIYFKAAWKTKFDPKDTESKDFFTENNSVLSPIDMMHIEESSFPYMTNEMMQMVDIPYGDSVYSMSILLPKTDHTVDDIIQVINNENWGLWTSRLFTHDIELFMPKFKMKYRAELKNNLTRLGMPSAFGNADFSGMADASLAISDVIHQSYVEVNEEGTEAAAVTVVVIIETSAGSKPIMNVNKPFLFAIRERYTNSILFLGKMMNPESN